MPFGLTNTQERNKEYEEYLRLILELFKDKELYANSLSVNSGSQKCNFSATLLIVKAFTLIPPRFSQSRIMKRAKNFMVYFDASHNGLGNRDHQKNYADVRRKPLEIQVGDKVMLKVSPWKGVIHFIKRGKLNRRCIGPFKILAKVETVELSKVHSTLHVTNIKECLSIRTLLIPLDEIQKTTSLNSSKNPSRSCIVRLNVLIIVVAPTLRFVGTREEVSSSPGNVVTVYRHYIPDHSSSFPTTSLHQSREDTFFKNKNDDNHEHVERVLDIVNLFNILGVSHDAFMLRVFPITLTGAAKRWVDRLPPGTVNSWDLLKKPLSKGIVHHQRLPSNLKKSATSSRKETRNYTRPRNKMLQVIPTATEEDSTVSEKSFPLLRMAEALAALEATLKIKKEEPKEEKKNVNYYVDPYEPLIHFPRLLEHYTEEALVEERLVEFKNQEVKYCEKIRGLEFKVESSGDRIEYLTNELELLKKEKGRFREQTDRLSISLKRPRQPSRESKIGQEQGGVRIKCYYTRPSFSVESNPDDLQNNSSFASENEESTGCILSKPEIKFVKATYCPTVVKTDKKEIVRKSTVKYAKLYRKPSKKSTVRGNQRNWNNLKS
nr:hypothetical protein [Tanacetum cinerariifolium]